jgi:HK97 family phage major capsid protein
MQRLAHAQGGVTRLETEAGSQMSFLGYEVVFTQKLNSTLTAQASTNIVAFGDLSMSSTLGDRRALSIATSDERYFDTDETAIRGTERVAINNHDLGDASNAGPTVVLATPSS